MITVNLNLTLAEASAAISSNLTAVGRMVSNADKGDDWTRIARHLRSIAERVDSVAAAVRDDAEKSDTQPEPF